MLGVALVVALALFGCGEPAEKSANEPSEAPDAVAEVEETLEPEVVESEQAEVKVEGEGFSLGEYSAGYGLIIRNTSTSEDAYDVAITVNLLNKSGNVVATDNYALGLLPASETFYFGGDIYEPGKATKLEAFADVGHSEPAEYELPQASNVRTSKESYGAGTVVKGQVKNTHEGELSSLARLGCVLLDRNGKVVGGGFTYLEADLPSGRTAAFQVYSGPANTPYKKVAKAKVSVENSFNIE